MGRDCKGSVKLIEISTKHELPYEARENLALYRLRSKQLDDCDNMNDHSREFRLINLHLSHNRLSCLMDKISGRSR